MHSHGAADDVAPVRALAAVVRKPGEERIGPEPRIQPNEAGGQPAGVRAPDADAGCLQLRCQVVPRQPIRHFQTSSPAVSARAAVFESRAAYARSMAAQDDDSQREAGKLPKGRLARTARVGGLVTGQGLRWAGMRTANRVRTPERAAEAQKERTAALVQELVDQLGQMRGAAMKVGQMISMVEFDGLPEDERDELQRKLAALRDDVPPVRFEELEKLMRQEFGGPLERVFRDFDERAFAAASIGQVHRATTIDGDDVAG